MSAGARSRHLPVILLGVAATLAVGTSIASVWLGQAGGRTGLSLASVLILLAGLGFVAIGVVVSRRQPDHRLGWMFVITGLEGIRYQTFLDYGQYALANPGSLPAGELVAWLQLPTYPLAILLFVLLTVLFPTGRPPGRWWSWPVWLIAAATLVQVAVSPLSYPDGGWAPLHTPERVPEGLAPWFVELQRYVMMVAALGGVAALFARLRPTRGALRRQVKWFAYGAGLTVGVSAVLNLPGVRGLLAIDQRVAIAGAMVIAVPVAAGIAVFAYHLWDADRLLWRSALYLGLTLVVGALYVGVATTLGVAAQHQLPLWVAALATVVATLALQPARRWLARTLLRRVGAERLAGRELLHRVGEALEYSHDPVELAPRLATTVRQGLGVAWVRLWLEPKPDTGGLARPVGTAGIEADQPATPAATVSLAHGTRMECGPKLDGGEITSADRELLSTLGRQAALAFHNARLLDEVASRLREIERQAEELAAARTRIARARDGERRRIERDLHDGVQQQLVALSTNLRLARNQLQRDPATADATLGDLLRDAGRLLGQLRELVHGIHPAALTDSGLLAAVEAQVGRLPLGVVIDAAPQVRTDRAPEPVEAAAYFVVCEALANVLKHSGADQARVTLSRDNGRLRVAVSDTGRGFVPNSLVGGTGLTGLRDRVEAEGGRFEVRSAPDAGATVTAEFPVPSRVEE